MFEFAGQLKPSLIVPTIDRYFGKLNQAIGTENPTILAKNQENRVNLNESNRAKKKIKLRKTAPVHSHETNKANHVATNDTGYSKAVMIMKEFLKLGNPKASHIQNAPKALTAEAAKNQVANHWLPAIQVFFGSVETFLFHLSKAEEGKKALQQLVESGGVNDIVKINIERFLQPAIRDWRNRLQAAVDQKAVEVHKGTGLAEQSLHHLNVVLNLESKREASARVLANRPSSTRLPFVLRNAAEVIRQVVAVVQNHKGGWHIESWSAPVFVSEVVNYNINYKGETQLVRNSSFMCN
jgi:hypothetical protein